MSEPVTTQIIATLEAWQQMEPQWNDLVAGSAAPSIFLTYEFLHSALAASGQEYALHIVLMYSGEALLGAVPLKITSRRICGLLSRTLQPIGGEEAEGNFFIVTGNEDIFYEAFSEYLAVDSSCLWSKIYFSLLPVEHPLTTLINRKFSKNRTMIVEQYNGFIHPFITISDSWEQYHSQLNHKFSHNLRTKARKSCSSGRLQVIRFSSPSEMNIYIDTYIELENRSWKTAHDSGISRSGSLCALYRNMLFQCARKGWAELTFLVLDGRLLAGGIGVIFSGRYSYLQTVYDASASDLSPGLILITLNVWRAFQAGLKVVDFMGNYVDYKRNWTNDEWQSGTVCVRKRFSGEGVAYLGAHIAAPLAAWRRTRQGLSRETGKLRGTFPLLAIDPASLTQQHVILDHDDIQDILGVRDALQHCPPPQEAAAACGLPDDEVCRLIAERAQARANRNWQQADAIRVFLLNNGIILNDTPHSTEWSRTENVHEALT